MIHNQWPAPSGNYNTQASSRCSQMRHIVIKNTYEYEIIIITYEVLQQPGNDEWDTTRNVTG